MDKPAMMKAMKASISEVLGQMFFMSIDFLAPDADPSEPETGKASIIAKIGFNGSPSGTFMLQLPAALARSVSADFLGTTPAELSDNHVTGTVLEMVNMLAGGALSAYSPHALFDLQIPELISIHDARALTGKAPDHIRLRIQTSESRMTFQLIIQE